MTHRARPPDPARSPAEARETCPDQFCSLDGKAPRVRLETEERQEERGTDQVSTHGSLLRGWCALDLRKVGVTLTSPRSGKKITRNPSRFSLLTLARFPSPRASAAPGRSTGPGRG